MSSIFFSGFHRIGFFRVTAVLYRRVPYVLKTYSASVNRFAQAGQQLKKDALAALVLLVASEDHRLYLEAERLAKAEGARARKVRYRYRPKQPLTWR